MTVEAGTIESIRAMLETATDQSETLTLAQIRDEVGVGHDDLTAALDELRERGEAVEEAPGEWRGPYSDEGIAVVEEGPEGSGAEDDGEPDVGVLRAALDGDGGARAPRPSPGQGKPQVGPEVVLTMGVARALGEEGLGKLAQAGVEEAAAAEHDFVLRVVG